MYPRIRDLREDKDLSQTKLAKLIGMSQTGYSKYETGENDIPTNILIKLARLHKTSVDYLLGLTDEKNPYPPAKTKTDSNHHKHVNKSSHPDMDSEM